jgi:hypothetical protein
MLSEDKATQLGSDEYSNSGGSPNSDFLYDPVLLSNYIVFRNVNSAVAKGLLSSSFMHRVIYGSFTHHEYLRQ